MKTLTELFDAAGANAYKRIWVVGAVVALVFAIPTVILKESRPWVICIPILLGAALNVVLERMRPGTVRPGIAGQARGSFRRGNFAELLDQAERNVADAQFAVGRAYERGEGVRRDLMEAIRWYRRAAEQGSTKGQHNLGLLLLEGKNDEVEALKWIFEAANGGSELTQFTLALLYETGESVPKNYQEAVRWYRKAAESGYGPAQHNLALMLARGEGAPRDLEEAKLWFEKASAQGINAEQVRRSEKLLRGEFVSRET